MRTLVVSHQVLINRMNLKNITDAKARSMSEFSDMPWCRLMIQIIQVAVNGLLSDYDTWSADPSPDAHIELNHWYDP